MMMIVGESGDDRGTQPVRLGVAELQRRNLLQMVVQQPGMVNQALQDQRLAARDCTALTPHDRARGELWTRRLVGSAGNRASWSYPLSSCAGTREPAARAGCAGGKTAR